MKRKLVLFAASHAAAIAAGVVIGIASRPKGPIALKSYEFSGGRWAVEASTPAGLFATFFVTSAGVSEMTLLPPGSMCVWYLVRGDAPDRWKVSWSHYAPGPICGRDLSKYDWSVVDDDGDGLPDRYIEQGPPAVFFRLLRERQ